MIRKAINVRLIVRHKAFGELIYVSKNARIKKHNNGELEVFGKCCHEWFSPETHDWVEANFVVLLESRCNLPQNIHVVDLDSEIFRCSNSFYELYFGDSMLDRLLIN